MKLRLNITEASDSGDHLKIKAQGSAEGDASWQPYRVFEMLLPNTQKNFKTYHLGRNLVVTIKAK